MNPPQENQPNLYFGQAELEHLQSKTPLGQLEFREEASSTNDIALELIENENTKYPLLVLTESQTSGRGRSTNQWWSAKGALTFSIALAANSTNLAPNRWPMASMTAGLAVCEALEQFLPDADLNIKWPNDVFANKRKICGILVETPRLHKKNLIIGIGINVNNSISNAPAEIADLATSMCDLGGRTFSLPDVLESVVTKLIDRLAWLGSRDQDLRKRWTSRCLLTNQKIQVNSPAKELTGICQGIDEEGALLLKTEAGLERCFAGTISILPEN